MENFNFQAPSSKYQNEERESFPQANDEEIERRRKRNRDASTKSRNKKKQIISDLSRQVQDLEARNKKLEEIKGKLKARNFKLENWNKVLTNELDGLHEKPPNDNSQLQPFCGFCEQTRSTVEEAFYHTCSSNPTVSRVIPHPTLIVPMNGEYETYRSYVQYEYPKVYPPQNQYTYSWGSSQFVQHYPAYGMPDRVVGDSCRHQYPPAYPQDMHRAPDPIQVVVPNMSNTFSTPMNSPGYATSVTTEFSGTPSSCCSSDPPNTFEKERHDSGIILSRQDTIAQTRLAKRRQLQQNEERESFPQANDEEIERRRKRNRDASTKSRNKRKQIISDLSRQVQDLETRNKKLEEIKGELKERNFKFENWNKVLTNELDGLHEKGLEMHTIDSPA
uniref:BZIP domain-containing protein n=1 Tax=Acrobeloides nanus TaxID=290746 RepID=A0A914CN43_9BILA